MINPRKLLPKEFTNSLGGLLNYRVTIRGYFKRLLSDCFALLVRVLSLVLVAGIGEDHDATVRLDAFGFGN